MTDTQRPYVNLTLLSACKQALAALEAQLEADDPQARTQIEWEAEPLATLRQAIAEAEGVLPTQPGDNSGEYTSRLNGRDGTFDLVEIVNPHGQVIATLYYWDEPDTDEAARARKAAKLICKHLNRWQISQEPVVTDDGGGASAVRV